MDDLRFSADVFWNDEVWSVTVLDRPFPVIVPGSIESYVSEVGIFPSSVWELFLHLLGKIFVG